MTSHTSTKRAVSAKRRAATSRPAPAKKAAAKRSPKITATPEAGFQQREDDGIYIPLRDHQKSVVAPNKLHAGLEASQAQIKKSLKNFASMFTQDFEVSEIELSVSFNAEGKFLGFGIGGAMSIKVKIRPSADGV